MLDYLKPALASAIICLPLAGAAGDSQHTRHDSKYAGLQDRAIKSLSEEDLAELRRGGGWGLALPAELNGLPGPAHVLELQDDLNLTPQQVQDVTAIFEEMRRDAIAAGERFIAAEAAISNAFAAGIATPATLKQLLATSANARAELRRIHLSRHLETPKLLSPAQIETYKILRGYSQDPCEAVPEGHDPAMWRRHNGCN